MNKITLIEEKNVTIKNTKQLIHNKKCGNIIVEEEYKDGKLTFQSFYPEKLFHQGYEPKKMRFYYYGKKLDYDSANNLYESNTKNIFVRDLKTFKDFDNLYCLWFGRDHCYYSLTNKYPLPSIFTLELWQTRFDLTKIEELLRKKKDPCVKSFEYRDNHWSNHDISGYKTLVVEYMPTPAMMRKVANVSTWERDELFYKKLGIDKFKIPVKYYDSKDEED